MSDYYVAIIGFGLFAIFAPISAYGFFKSKTNKARIYCAVVTFIWGVNLAKCFEEILKHILNK